MNMSLSLIFLGLQQNSKAVRERIHILLLLSQSHRTLCSLNRVFLAFARVHSSPSLSHRRRTSSYLHPDDVRHPADLRLPLLAAEMPEEAKLSH